MGNKSKNKDYLVQGTILVAASFIARIIGMVYRIPLKTYWVRKESGITVQQTSSIISF